ncbi:GntR family transcriptional regulator [Geosporobacter ferrireducens]|uniref:HTH gntR-type domain-containing protein n=1 Tax=Geosporobacter ferrireducens TaxID=1424294 RepID=A0A1D8GHF3_9FIRM|nr:GntR family transcriptional regulator [Geosporobacter ferrireducens]AOT70327.1 hypothetical protein Gferi_12425 [Geosporobacter ferrireducens]MTI54295.1 GntR family transcriptional regulator [Geosporobacter ferrireducens]
MIAINKNIPIPLYYRVKEDIINKIKDGTYKVEEKVPSENELQKIHNVSSITVRKALTDLVNEGYLYRIQGKGTFVAKPKINRMLNLMSFTDELKEKGIEAETRVIEIKAILDETIAEKLNINKDNGITRIKRLRLVDGVPIALQTSHIPSNFLSIEEAGLIEDIGSLYKILETKGITPHSAKEIYNISILEEKAMYTLFGQKKGTPVFDVKRITYNSSGVPFEYAESILRWDRYSIEVELKSEY